MDPYVTVKNTDMELDWKTKVCNNGSKNPKWEGEKRELDICDPRC